MARYIDADALIEMLNNKAKTDLEMGLYNHHALTESFNRFVERQPTADVVPKSEYDAVVSALDNSTKEFLKLHDYYQKQKAETDKWKGRCIDWFEVAYLKSQRILEIEAELSKAKADVEEISGKYEDLKLKYAELQKDKDELIAWGNDKKTEVKLDFTEEEIMRSLSEAGIEVSDNSISEIKAEVAIDILREIDNALSKFYCYEYGMVRRYIPPLLIELKKKYTEDKS